MEEKALDISYKNLVNKIEKAVHLNANNLNFKACYDLCANKYKLSKLWTKENQVIFGRRGTGKTTILKAFTHCVNYKDSCSVDKICWYTRMDKFIPTSAEIYKGSTDEISVYCIREFLESFVNFLIKRSEILEGLSCFSSKQIKRINKEIYNLWNLIENGSKENKTISEKETVSKINVTEKSIETAIAPDNRKKRFEALKINLKHENKNNKTIGNYLEKEYVYVININEITEQIELVLELMEIKQLYICIDEFTQIDRDITFSIQPRVSQLLKQLFFSSEIITVKIASVLNENRMQSKHINGIREGIEVGNDIFSDSELDLDTMFEHDNAKAYSFFVRILVNDFLWAEGYTLKDREKRRDLGKYIIKTLFAKDSFNHLICGSQGIPRNFGAILLKCLANLDETKKEKITVAKVIDSIIDFYNASVRASIPNSSIICSSIDEYVTEKKQRFFLIEIRKYNEGLNYFNGLISNNALQQYPNDLLPRKLRNKYRLIYVHYGNYLDSLYEDRSKLYINSMKGDGLLFPELPDDLLTHTHKYVLSLPQEAFGEYYCSYCKEYFTKDPNVNKHVVLKCPKCENIISVWR